MIPKETTPLTKLIRTMEGWIIVLVNGGLIAVPIVTSVSPATSLKYGTIFNAVAVGSRSVLKGIAALAGIIGPAIFPKGAPTELTKTERQASSDPDPTPAELEQGPSEMEAEMVEPPDPSVLTELGAPADKIEYFGAPNEVQPGSEVKS